MVVQTRLSVVVEVHVRESNIDGCTDTAVGSSRSTC